MPKIKLGKKGFKKEVLFGLYIYIYICRIEN